MTAPLIRMRGVTKRYPGVVALDGVDLDLAHGERLALVGENGAGKSTLMKLLSGVVAPDEGTIEVDGEPVVITGPAHARALGIGIIHQELGLIPDLTVAENIALGREPRTVGIIDDRRIVRRAQEVLDRLGMVVDPRAMVRDLPIGKQQMVEIAKALADDQVRVLILDEPTAALNEAEVQALFGIIGRFVSDDTAVVYISHRMDELPVISDRITVLRDGANAGDRPTATTPMREIVALMVGREIVGERRPGPTQPGDVALRVEGLCSRHPLHDVSFEVRRGEILGFAGLMGAGRTELARAIVGADPITAGTIEVAGRVVRIPTPAAAARLGIGYLSEDRKRYGALLEQTVADNIVLSSLDRVSTLGIVRDGAVARVARTMVERLRVRTPSIRQLVRNLSGGNQQKVIVAKWLYRDCDVLIFDEPTRGIDVGAKDEIYTLLEGLASDGKAIVVISSELPEVLRLSHRIAVMGEGRIAAILDNHEATQESIMAHATRFHDAAVVER